LCNELHEQSAYRHGTVEIYRNEASMNEAPEELHTPVKTPGQLIGAVIASFVIPIVVMVLLATYANHVLRTGAGTDALSPAQVAQRIKPLAEVTIDTSAPPPSAAASGAAPASAATDNAQAASSAMAAIAALPAQSTAPAATVAAPGAGKALFESTCTTCHTPGLLGAPKFGNHADWAPRLKDPMDVIYNYALHGKGNMPPRGGSNAPDADIKAAVDYMVNAAK
jgi:cytochrome c5